MAKERARSETTSDSAFAFRSSARIADSTRPRSRSAPPGSPGRGRSARGRSREGIWRRIERAARRFGWSCRNSRTDVPDAWHHHRPGRQVYGMYGPVLTGQTFRPPAAARRGRDDCAPGSRTSGDGTPEHAPRDTLEMERGWAASAWRGPRPPSCGRFETEGGGRHESGLQGSTGSPSTHDGKLSATDGLGEGQRARADAVRADYAFLEQPGAS